MLKRRSVSALALMLAVCFARAYGEEYGQYEKRSSGYPSFNEVLESSAQTLSIQNTDCVFGRSDSGANGCETEYKKNSGQCFFHMILAQLFPDVSLGTITNNFLTPEKFTVEDFKIDKCNGNRHETVTFNAKSVESVEMAPRYLTLSAASELIIYWSYKEEFNLQKLSVNLQGFTSVGGNTAVPIKLRKKIGREDYVVVMEMASLNVNNFLEKFGIDTAEMISDKLQFEKNRLGLTSLNIKSPDIKGLFSAGEGFELAVTGKISAPDLPSDASHFYVIVQDFRKSAVEEGETSPGFNKPIAAIFALYKKGEADVTDAVMSLTGLSAPQLKVFRRVKELAITVATQEIIFINHQKLNALTSKFVPSKGMSFLEKGINILHYTDNSNADIKNEEGQTKEKILYRCEVKDDKLSWTSPEVIETTMQQVATMAFPDKSLSSIAIKSSTKVLYDSIDFVRETKHINVKFNLSEIVPVLDNNLVSLLNTTMSLKSAPNQKGDYQEWELAGGGQEVILDELVDITVEVKTSKTYVTAPANIFDMKTLRNRTKANYLDEELSEHFPYTQDFPIDSMRYEASFEKTSVLRLKGQLVTSRKADIEILYYFEESGPELKVAVLFKNEYLHKVVNLFYGEQKMSSTWMKFQKIGIVLRKKMGNIEFDREFFQDLEYFDRPAGRGGGVGILAQNLILSNCHPDAMMCNFLSMHDSINELSRMKYYGRLSAKKVAIDAKVLTVIWLSETKNFGFGTPVTFKMTANEKGDRNVLLSQVYFSNTRERYPAKIYDDGSNKLILDIGDKESSSAILLNLDYALMDPLQSKYSIPAKEQLEKIVYKSRLHLGTVAESTITFSGGTGRQNVYLNKNTRQFVGEKSRLSITAIENAFGLSASLERIKDAVFNGRVVVAYNSADEVWDVPDFDIQVKKGLHFYGKLTLNAEEEYEAIVSMTDSRQLEVEFELPPLRYGKSLKDTQGRDNFDNVNLFLIKDPERQETGPTLYITNEAQRIKGYCRTIGMQGEFESTYERQPGGGMEYKIELNGKMYDEVDDASAIVTTSGEGKPADFSFKYKIDLTSQARTNLKQTFRESLGKIQQEMKEGKDNANTVHGEVEEQYNGHVRRKAEHENEMNRVKAEIFEANQNINADIMDISTNCIDKCKTVSMPGIEWKEDCLSSPGETKRTMKCMTWTENKEKVVNVICLLKCEANKYRASGSGLSELTNARVLLNRFKQQKTMSENEARMIAVLEEAKTVAEETKQLIEDSTNIDSEITALLAKQEADNMATINKVAVDQDINNPHPPCLPFHLIFTINAEGQTPQDGTYDVCFNGEFYQNLGVAMLRAAYPQIDKMYKALEEAELRYASISGIKKSLERVMDDIKKNIRVPGDESGSRRSDMDQPLQDPLERRLMKISKRNLPKFTSFNDKTQMGFRHYSPWAVARRSNPFYSMKAPAVRGAYNMSAFEGHSACQKARTVMEHYKDVASGLRTVAEHYQRGKEYYGSTKENLKRELQDSYSYIMERMNATKLAPIDQESMMYWFRYTESGLNDYFATYSQQLAEHNLKGLEFWRSDISAFFGKGRLFNELHQLGHNAYTRSNIPKKEAHVRSFNTVGETIKRILTQPGITLEEAHLMVNNVDSQIQHLHKSTFACS